MQINDQSVNGNTNVVIISCLEYKTMIDKTATNGYFYHQHVSLWKSILLCLYNPEEQTVLGKTGSGWVKIAAFYFVFYSVLAAVAAISWWVFYQTIDPRTPKWRLSSSMIGTNPGLGFRPMPPIANVESSLIWYKGTDRSNYRHWVESLESFLNVYKKPGLTPGRGQNIYNCNYRNYPPKGRVCEVDVRNWHPCTQENQFNYHKSGPCIFLKLNKIYGWIPEYYNSSINLPPKMPKDLRDHIATVEQTDALMLNTIWISCEGENPADVENLGPVNYIPQRGFPGFFFPFENSEGYLSPILAIHLDRPKNGILINLQCKAWAKNIKHSNKEKMGLVHLELMID